MRHGGVWQIEGSSPDKLRRDLAEVCASFNSGIQQLGKRNASVLEQTRVAGAMYAGVLRVHPFADGAAVVWSPSRHVRVRIADHRLQEVRRVWVVRYQAHLRESCGRGRADVELRQIGLTEHLAVALGRPRPVHR